VFAVALSQAQR